MEARRYAVLGYPLGHTMSPFIHEKLFAVHGVSAVYEKRELPPQALSEELPALRSLSGFNLTIPHKSAILPLLDQIDGKAALYGAVNTVKCGECLTGYNTDCVGFLRALEEASIPLAGKILLCGAGGAAHMMAFEAALAGGTLTIAARPSGIRARSNSRRQSARSCRKLPYAFAHTTRWKAILTCCSMQRLLGCIRTRMQCPWRRKPCAAARRCLTQSIIRVRRCFCAPRGKMARNAVMGCQCSSGRLPPRRRFGTAAPSPPRRFPP